MNKLGDDDGELDDAFVNCPTCGEPCDVAWNVCPACETTLRLRAPCHFAACPSATSDSDDELDDAFGGGSGTGAPSPWRCACPAATADSDACSCVLERHWTICPDCKAPAADRSVPHARAAARAADSGRRTLPL